MGKKKGAGAGTAVLLAAVMLCCLILPAKALFTGDGSAAPYLKFPEVHRMWLEIGVLFLLFGGLISMKISGRIRLALTALGVLLFCWLHVVFLPMAVTGLYLGYLLLAGRFLRTRMFRMKQWGGWPADFVLGCSFVITLFCVLSVAGIREIPVLRLISIGLGTVLLLWYLFEQFRQEEERIPELFFQAGERLEQCSVPVRLGIVFILVMLLIQVGRINLAMDFDTMWYGVRSEYVLNGSGGIYEDPGMVSMVYVYSKGWEILTLPLCDLPSHTYLSFFHIWLMVLGIFVTGRIARLSMEEDGAFLAMLLTAAIPGIINMSVSVKTDMITWFIQLIMIELFFTYVKESDRRGNRPVPLLILTAGAYLLSLTMKPTSLVFSTAVFGMLGIYLLVSGRLSVRAKLSHWLGLLFPLAALVLVWLRTYLITGMPVTSVFTSIFARIGFEMKYPFATSALPSNYEEGEPALQMLLRRLYQMLLSPEGKDMLHICMAWGSSLMLYLPVVMLLSVLGFALLKRDGRRRAGYSMRKAANLIFWPFLAVNIISLVMLYQIDGNYFMLLYTMILLIGCQFFSEFKYKKGKRVVFGCTVPLLALNLFTSSVTCWAWSAGFTPVQVVNKGYVDHEAKDKEWLVSRGNETLWMILEANPEYRVIAFGDHPYCLQFPCKVQSYKDITAPWGNVELVNTPEAFEEYMEYSKTDYIYAQANYLGEDNWAWSYGLLRELIARGSITDCIYEWGNFLGRRAETPIPAEEAAENLRIFDEQYWTYISQEKWEMMQAQAD